MDRDCPRPFGTARGLGRLAPMSVLFPTNRRRAAAAALIPLLVLLSACGVDYDFRIKEDDTVDFTYLVWDSSGSGYVTEEGCSEEGMGATADIPEGVEITYTFTKRNGDPACEVMATNVPLDEFNDGTSITHEGDTYVFTMEKVSYMEEYKDDIEASLSVTFPGKVTEHSGNSTVKGNTVTWDNFLDEQGDLRAVGGDGSGSMALLLVGGGVLLLVVVGAIVAVVLVNNSKKRKAAQLAAPMPGAVPQPMQGPAPQPGVPMQGQPGVPMQGPVPQPGQQPFPGDQQPFPGQ